MKRILAYSVIGAFLASAPVSFAATNAAVAPDAPQVQKQEAPATTVKATPAKDATATTAKTVKAEPEAQASTNKLGPNSLSVGKKVDKKDAAKPEVEITKVTKTEKMDAKPEAEKPAVTKADAKDAAKSVTAKPEAVKPAETKTSAAAPATAVKSEPAKVN